MTRLRPASADFYAKWCGPCQMMVPILEDVASENQDKVAVAKVDTDKYPALGSRFSIEGLPTFCLFKGGEVVERVEGVITKEKMMEIVEKHL